MACVVLSLYLVQPYLVRQMAYYRFRLNSKHERLCFKLKRFKFVEIRNSACDSSSTKIYEMTKKQVQHKFGWFSHQKNDIKNKTECKKIVNKFSNPNLH